jgi:hypothetical protein
MKHHILKANAWKVQLHAFLALALDEGRRVANSKRDELNSMNIIYYVYDSELLKINKLDSSESSSSRTDRFASREEPTVRIG